MDVILNFIIIVAAALIGCMGLYMLAIWKFRKPKEDEKNSETIKKMELFMALVLIILGAMVYMNQDGIAQFLTQL